MCNPEIEHYSHSQAVAQADYAWVTLRRWYRVIFCSCGSWCLLADEIGLDQPWTSPPEAGQTVRGA